MRTFATHQSLLLVALSHFNNVSINHSMLRPGRGGEEEGRRGRGGGGEGRRGEQCPSSRRQH